MSEYYYKDKKGNQYITVTQYANAIGKSRQWVYRLIKKDKLKALKIHDKLMIKV